VRNRRASKKESEIARLQQRVSQLETIEWEYAQLKELFDDAAKINNR
jgi:hypothetical protein